MPVVAIVFRRRWFLGIAIAVVPACGGNRSKPVDSATADTSSRVAQSPRDSTTRPDSPAGTAPSGRADSARPDTAVTADSVVALLETGCGGGVTGGGGGAFVTADGRFYTYQRNGPPPNAKRELTFVRKDSAGAATLVETAERDGITRIKYSEPSNMTCHLSLERGGASYEVAWGIGTKPRAIQKLMAVAAELEAAAR